MALREVLKRIQDAQRIEGNEFATRQALILPILHELGWDIWDTNQVAPEWGIGIKKKYRVDYALKHPNSKRRVYIEVKPQGTSLEKEVSQMLRYAFEDGTRVCTLTNGIDWWFYLPFEEGSPEDRRFAELNIKKDSIEQLIDEFETYLSYKSLAESDKVEQHAKQALKARRNRDNLNKELPRIWQDMLDNPPFELIEFIENRVNKLIGLRPSNEQVSCFLSGQKSIPANLDQASTKIDTVPKKKERKNTTKSLKKPDQPVSITLFGVRHLVKTWKDVWEVVASELYNKHTNEFTQVVSKSGRRKSHVENFVEINENSIHNYRQIKNSEYWIHAQVGSEEIKIRCHYLLEQFGYHKTELKIHF